jgi:ATP-binding cassette subfamily B protein
MSGLRATGALLGMAWGSGRRLALALIGLTTLSVVSSGLCGVALKLLVDAAATGDRLAAVWGAALAVVGLCGAVAWLPLGGVVSLTFQERVRENYDSELVRLATSISDLEIQSSKEYTTTLQLLSEDDRDAAGTAILDIVSFTTATSLLLATAVFLGLQAPQLALVPIAVLPLSWVSWRVDRALIGALEQTAQDQRLSHELFRLGTSPGAAAELRVFGTSSEIRLRHQALQNRILVRSRRATLRAVLVHVGSWVTFGLLYGITVVTMARRAAAGRASPGDMVLVITLVVALLGTLQGIASQLATLTRMMNAARRLDWLRRLNPPDDSALAGTVPQRLSTGITLENVSFTYAGASGPAVRDLDVVLPAGSVVALVGENGAGKSTLVKLLCGLYSPSQGRVLIDGTDLREVAAEHWRRRIGAVFQDFVRFEFRVREGVGFGDLPNMSDGAALQAATTRAEATELVATLPQGWDTQLGTTWHGGTDLSAGQWQRLALARGLMREDPLLVVLDEPTATLDAVAERQLFEQFAHVASDARSAEAVTVIVSHRFSTARLADLILVMNGGELVEMGTHEQLLGNDGLYRSLYTLQASSYQ